MDVGEPGAASGWLAQIGPHVVASVDECVGGQTSPDPGNRFAARCTGRLGVERLESPVVAVAHDQPTAKRERRHCRAMSTNALRERREQDRDIHAQERNRCQDVDVEDDPAAGQIQQRQQP